MAIVYTSNALLNPVTTYTSYVPYCDGPVAVDGLYQARHYQEIYYAPEPPAQIQYVRKRLPDPPPDVIERVVVVPQPKKYIYQVVEIPSKPPPIVQERVVHQSPNAPLCGGTYQVQVPPNFGGQAVAPTVRSSSSTMYAAPASNYVQASPSFISGSPSYVQSSPVYL